MAAPGSRTKTRQTMTRDGVMAAAVELADEVGLDGLTMRELARRVGLKPMSLYHHVDDKDDLLDGMVDAVFAEIELPADTTDWKAALRLKAITARRSLTRHPWAIGLLESRTTPGPANLQHHDRVLGILHQAGFALMAATRANAILDSYTYGFALQEASLPFGSPDELEEVAQDIITLMPPDQYPHLRQTAIELAEANFDFSDQFELGLDMILEVLDQLRNSA